MAILQGGSVNLQGGSPSLQGGSPSLQGGAIQLQGANTPKVNLVKPVAAPGASSGAASNAAAIASLQASIAAANQKVYAPALDTNAIFSQANNNAASNVNPYYTKLLNDFVSQQSQARTLQTQQTQTNIKNLQDLLAQQQEANAVTGTRTGEDAATAEATAAQTTENRQQDQGTAFDANRLQEAAKLSQSGLAGSGLGSKQQATTEQTFATTEARQATADQAVKTATELTKSRTFEDLATSNKNAATSETKGEAQANFDLNKFIVGQAGELQQQQQELEIARKAAIATETAKQNHILVQSFINSIANPAQRQAAIQAYGAI